MKRDRGGFTLIELLVVVAIIGLLIAILLPSLGNAKAAAKRTQCLATIRGWSQAVYNYASDYNGYFAAKVSSGLGSQWDQNPKAYNATADAGIYAGQGGNALTTKLRFCPAEQQQFLGDPGVAYYGNRPLPSYKFACYLPTGSSAPSLMQKMNKFRTSGDTLLMLDSNARNNYGDCVAFIRKDGGEGVFFSLRNDSPPAPRTYNGVGYDTEAELKERHRGKGSVLFLDGHAEAVGWSVYVKNIPASETDGDLNKRWTRLR